MKRINQRRLRGALASAFGLVALGLIPLGFGGAEQNATPVFAQTANADEPVDFKTLYANFGKALSEGRDSKVWSNAEKELKELTKLETKTRSPQEERAFQELQAISSGYAQLFPDGSKEWRAGKKAGERRVLKINGVEFPFRWCPPGTFTMGTAPNADTGDFEALREIKRREDKQHSVRLTKGFWILETEVTQEMWAALSGGANPSAFSGDSNPVENVSWFDCQAALFGMMLQAPCLTSPRLTEMKLPFFLFRLPTEAEWEYACRAGTTGLFNGKSGDWRDVAWVGESAAKQFNVDTGQFLAALQLGMTPPPPSGYSSGLTSTSPVAQKEANAWGIYDMHGNVWEWCWDWFDENAYSASGAGVDPVGPANGRFRVQRGGSFGGGWNLAHSGARGRAYPASRNASGAHCGFRFILTETTQEESEQWAKRRLGAMQQRQMREQEFQQAEITRIRGGLGGGTPVPTYPPPVPTYPTPVPMYPIY